MPNDSSTGKIMRAGLLLAAVIIILRIVLEQLGAPEAVNAIFGVAWLYFLLPVCFGLKIAGAGEASPVKRLFMNVLLFAVYTRIMVMITYITAYYFQWQAPRFSLSGGGNVGPGVSPMTGILVIPVRNALIWIIFAAIVGMLIGGTALWLKRRSVNSPAASGGSR